MAACASNGGSNLTGYTVQWKAASDAWTVPSDVTEAAVTGTTHTITGLTDGTPYTVRVVAVNDVGSGAPSTEETAIPQAPTPPRGPREIGGIVLNSTIPGVIDVSWDAPGETPANYRVMWTKVGESYLTWTDLTGNAFPTVPSHTITGLEDGWQYQIKVRASYNGTAGDWSDEVTATTAAGAAIVPNTPATGLPVITGTAEVGQTLAADASGIADADGMTSSTLRYQWISDDGTTDTEITNATASSYVLAAGDLNNAIKVRVAFTDDAGHEESLTSAATPAVTPAPATTVVEPSHQFITTWQTTLAGESITIPVGGATGIYTIDWGDGNADYDVSGDRRHTYDDAGTYTVRISGDFARIYLNGDQPNAGKLQSIEQWGDVRWESMGSAFHGASSVVYRAADTPDLSYVASTRYMFKDASSFNGNISAWNVSSVTDMFGMFWGASSFNGSLSTWDVSSVTDMKRMFSDAASFNADLSDWDVSSVTDMARMFHNADSFNADLSDWDVLVGD